MNGIKLAVNAYYWCEFCVGVKLRTSISVFLLSFAKIIVIWITVRWSVKKKPTVTGWEKYLEKSLFDLYL